MLRFCKLLVTCLILVFAFQPFLSCAEIGYARPPRYNLDSLCYLSTDVVKVSLVRHQSSNRFGGDTFTATVLNTLGGDYKIGDKIELPYTQVILPPHPCSFCILFIAREQFQLDMTGAKVMPPQVTEILPVDAVGRVHRYFQWEQLFTRPDEVPEKDPDEQSHPMLIEECNIIKSRWTAVNQVRPLLSHPLRQENVPDVMRVYHQHQQYVAGSEGLEDVIADAFHARLADYRNPASHQSDDLVRRINFIFALEHIVAVH